MQTGIAPGTVLVVDCSIVRPFKGQPRTWFDPDRLEELAQSIREVGQRMPAEARRLTDDPEHEYELIDGQRRWEALRLAKCTTILIWVNEPGNEEQQFLGSVIANFGREDHTPMETAQALRRVLAMPQYRNGTQNDRYTRVAKVFAKSPAWVEQNVRLLDLHPEVQKMLEPDASPYMRLGSAIGSYLATIQDKELQLEIAVQVATDGLNLQQARLLARRKADATGAKIGRRPLRPSDAVRSLKTFLGRLACDSECVLEMPQKAFKTALKGMPGDDREALLRGLKENIDRLLQLQEIIKSS